MMHWLRKHEAARPRREALANCSAIFARMKRSAHHAEGVHIINSEGIAYHQHEVLYIIKPQENPAPKGLMRYKGGLPPRMIYTACCAVMICQACGLDKKS